MAGMGTAGSERRHAGTVKQQSRESAVLNGRRVKVPLEWRAWTLRTPQACATPPVRAGYCTDKLD